MHLQHPFTCMCSGPTGSGKTSLIKAIIEHKMIDPFPQNILWLYGADQPMYKLIENVTFHKGIPGDIEDRFDPKVTNLLVVDDLMT